MESPGPTSRSFLTRRWYVLLVLLIYLLHLLLVILACPPRVVFGDLPAGIADYNTHYQQVSTVGQALRQFGRTWAYDPNMLAGVPAGLFFDVDNKAHSLFTYGLTRLGVSQPVAFNLFAVLACLLAPLSLLLAARLFSMGRGASIIALSLGGLLWHFDHGLRYFWSSGMVSFAFASHLSVVVLALHWRMLTAAKERYLIPLMVLLPLSVLVHVWAVAILAVPMVGAYIHRWGRLGVKGHLRVWLVIVVTLLANAFWLLPALGQLKLLEPAAWLGQATPLYFLTDYLGIVGEAGGLSRVHTFYRYVALCGMGLTLWRWHKRGDSRLFVAELTIFWLLGLSYLGALVPILNATEPYRFIAPTMLMAALFGSFWFAEILTTVRPRSLTPPVKGMLVLLLLLVVPRLLQEMLFFIPELAPEVRLGAIDPESRGRPHTDAAALLPKPQPPFRLRPVPKDYLKVADYLAKHCRQEGRVLVQDWPLAEYLRWATDRPILGGFPERRTVHQAANLFRRLDDPRLLGNGLSEYLRRYNVRYLILSGLPHPQLERRQDLMERIKLVGLIRIYRTRHQATYFQRGSGRVTASLNRLQVDGAMADPGSNSVVLRFHHMSTLRCHPGCEIGRAEIPFDPAGFIEVRGRPALPESFVIEHRY
jgi:hypothetical protein